MRRSATLPLLGLGLAAVLAACADGAQGPNEPLAPRPMAQHVAPACDGNLIRQTLAGLYPTTTFKSFVLPTFNQADKDDRFGTEAGEAASDAAYYLLIEDVVKEYKEGELLKPGAYESTQEGVYVAVSSLFVCADESDPDLRNIIYGIAGQTPAPGGATYDTYNPNTQLCVVRDPSQATTCTVPSKDAIIHLPIDFLDRQALVLIEPADAALVDALLEDYGTIWSGRWRMRIEPIDAQNTVGSPAASVAVCTRDHIISASDRWHHAPSGVLKVAQVSESNNETITLLGTDNTQVDDLVCTEVATSGSSIGRAGSSAPTLLASAWTALRSTGGMVGHWFAPKPLYAFDGGIGGKVTSFASYFSGVEQPAISFRQIGYTTATPPVPFIDPEDSKRTVLSLKRRASAEVIASKTGYGVPIYPASCLVTSSHNRVSVANFTGQKATDFPTGFTLTASNSTGTAIITANCGTDGTSTLTVSVIP